jgi:hypothetical protein
MNQTRPLRKTAEEQIDTFIHASFLLDEMATIIPDARTFGLECIILKGAALHISGLLPDGDRPITDVDLLVPEDDYQRWRKFFETNGYEPLTSSTSSFIKHGPTSLVFDLHTTLRFLDNRCLEQAWRKRVPHIWADETFHLLPAEINLLYLALHMTVTHGYASQKWINDIDTVIRFHQDTIDWEKVRETAWRNHVIAPLAATLHHLQRSCGTPVPVATMVMLDRNASPLRRRLFTLSLSLPHGLPWFEYFAPFLIRKTRLSLLFSGIRTLFPPLRFMKQRYNTQSTFKALLWYPFRLLQLGVKLILASVTALSMIAVSSLINRRRRYRFPDM